MPSPIDPDTDHGVGEPVHDDAAAILQRSAHRYTEGRRRLVALLAGSDRPLTLPEILERDPELPQSSVYRNLDVLEKSGVVRRLASGAERAHFELAEPLLGHHHHLICVGCGTIEDVLLDDRIERLVDGALADAAADAGFTPLHHNVDLHGHCTDCS